MSDIIKNTLVGLSIFAVVGAIGYGIFSILSHFHVHPAYLVAGAITFPILHFACLVGDDVINGPSCKKRGK